MGHTLRIVKYGVSAAEKTFKMTGSVYTQIALPIRSSTRRAIDELIEQETSEGFIGEASSEGSSRKREGGVG